MTAYDREEQIERYLAGTMTLEEVASFERLMADNAEVAEEVALQRRINETLKNRESIQFRERLQRIREQRRQNTPAESRNPTLRQVLWVVLVAAFLILAWKFIWPAIQPHAAPVPGDQPGILPGEPAKTPVDTALQAAKTNEGLPGESPNSGGVESADQNKLIALARAGFEPLSYQLKGSEENDQSFEGTLVNAANALEQGNYDVAIRLSESFKPGDKDYWPAKEIAAHACFYKGDYEGSIRRFEEMAGNLPASLAEKLEGNLLLAYLAAGNINTQGCRTLLSKIENDPWHPFHKKAIELARNAGLHSTRINPPQK